MSHPFNVKYGKRRTRAELVHERCLGLVRLHDVKREKETAAGGCRGCDSEEDNGADDVGNDEAEENQNGLKANGD